MSKCSSCGTEIEWARTEGGKLIPLEIGLVLGGNIEIHDRVAVVVAGHSEVSRRVSHFVTCPDASTHRRN